MTWHGGRDDEPAAEGRLGAARSLLTREPDAVPARESVASGRLPSLSVIIPNYNYAEFIGEAIESALAIDWPDVEVIVVDDGSTDGSRQVIEGYGARITAIFQANAGQIMACNHGFSRSRGDIVIFLDSDDIVRPEVMREIAKVWRRGISKVQFQMASIDASGNPIGYVFPQYHVGLTPESVRSWAMTAFTYPTPPGSGNAYSREFLQRLFPLDKSCGNFSDSCCIAAAPYLGDVVTIPKPVFRYRIHGRNDGAVTNVNVEQFRRPVALALPRFAFARRVAATVGIEVPEIAFRKSLTMLQYRVASFHLDRRNHPIPGDTTGRLLADGIRAALTPQGRGVKEAIAVAFWVFSVLLSPRSLAQSLILWKFNPKARPQRLHALLNRLGVLRRAPEQRATEG